MAEPCEIREATSELLVSHDSLQPWLEVFHSEPQEALKALFRWVHTVKSAFGFLEFGDLEAFTHRFEDWLQELKTAGRSLKEKEIELLKLGTDLLLEAVQQLHQAGHSDVQSSFEAFLEDLRNLSNSSAESIRQCLQYMSILQDALEGMQPSEQCPAWVNELETHLEDLVARCEKQQDFRSEIVTQSLLLEKVVFGDQDLTHQTRLVFKGLEDIIMHGPAAHSHRDPEIVEAAGHLVQVLDPNNELRLIEWKALRNLVESIPELLEEYWKLLWQKLLVRAEVSCLQPEQFLKEWTGDSTTESVKENTAAEQVAAKGTVETVRVDATSIDSFTRSTEALIMNRNFLEHIEEEVRSYLPARVSTHLRHGLNALQESVQRLYKDLLFVRASRAKMIFDKLDRVGRQLSRETGKSFRLDFRGADIEMDRMLIPILSEPLIHILRNAVDHGLETPEQRVAAEKSMEGQIVIEASTEEAWLQIVVSDDGRGIHPQKVLKKAIEKGLARADVVYSQEEILAFLCTPGFSTAEAVTSLSGRGVGLDVVASTLKQNGGEFRIESEQGQGTRFFLRLPLRAGVMTHNLLLIRSGDQVLGVREKAVVEAVSLAKVTWTSNARQRIIFRERVIPFFTLNDRLFCGHEGNQEEGVVLILQDETGHRMAMGVDGVEKSMQAIIEPFRVSFLKKHPYLCGTVSVGTGRPILVLEMSRAGLWLEADQRGQQEGISLTKAK